MTENDLLKKRIAEIEDKSAKCYASMDRFTNRLYQLAEVVDHDSEFSTGQVEYVDEEDSLVHSLNDLKAVASASDE